MTGRVAHIIRHPIKSHGREELTEVTLQTGATMPWDRTWAVAHEGSQADGSEWAHCRNFTRIAAAPEMAAISTAVHEATGSLTVSHPARPDLTFDPDAAGGEFIDWVAPLMPENRAASVGLVSAPGRGMTDSAFPSVSIGNLASHRVVEQRMGRELSIHRWRCNIWLDGLAPWQEFEWAGCDIQIGAVTLRVVEPAARCEVTMANPETGKRDADTLGTLDSFGHRDFTMLAEVSEGGVLKIGDGLVDTP